MEGLEMWKLLCEGKDALYLLGICDGEMQGIEGFAGLKIGYMLLTVEKF